MSFRAAREAAAAATKGGKQASAATANASAAPAAVPAANGHFTRYPHPVATTPTTRLCVKNLPVHVKEDRLRSVFSEKGEVTDVKLLKTSDGRSRKMAFIGFRSVEAATLALAHFNKTFLDTSKIDVEFAVNPREAKEQVQPWSRHSEGSSRYAEAHRDYAAEAEAAKLAASTGKAPQDAATLARSAIASNAQYSKSALYGLTSNAQLSKLLSDPKFQEYLHVMSSRSKNKFWSNTTLDDPQAAVAKPGSMMTTEEEFKAIKGEKAYQTYEDFLKSQKKEKKNKKGGAGDDDEEEEDDDEYFDQPMLDRDAEADGPTSTIPSKGKATAKASAAGAASDDDDADADAMDTSSPAAPLALNSAVSDLDYLRSKQGDDKDFDADSDMEDASPATSEEKAPGQALEKKAGKKRKTTTSDAAAIGGGETGAAAADGDDAGLQAAYEADQAQEAAARTSKTEADELMESGRLFLRNLSYSVREEDLKALFAPFGTVSECHLPVDDLGKSKGFAHVSFLFPAQALAAQRSLDGQFFLGRLLHILNGRPKPVQKSEWERLQELGDDAKGAVTYKKKKELEQQALAGTRKDQQSWNSLFIRSDTVTDAIAAKYGLAKGDILDTTNSAEGGSGSGMAVRLALAETTLIAETKAFLAAHGVDVRVFDQPKGETARSDTALLVKNIPFTTEADELRRLFAKFGQLGACVMPPSRTVALVEFIEAADAKKAFKGLAYKKFKFVPLYLEWAPKGAFDGSAAVAGAMAGAAAASGGVIAGKKSATATEEEEEATAGEGHTLYVKNLNFSTTDAVLSALFARVGPLRSCTISMKKNTKQRPHTDDPPFLSMGYGFVEFRKPEDARKALKELQGVQCENHALELKLSSRGASTTTTPAAASAATKTKPRTAAAAAHVAASAASGATTADGSAAPSSKLLVKNVPFETTARELRELFAAFGSIQRIRLPKKFGQLGHRGFAFIDMTTKAEAKNAMENVKHSHLYGRHLVIEYAAAQVEQDSQDVEGLRQKTADQYRQSQGGAPPHKKRKVQDEDADEIDQAFDKQFK